MNLVLFEPQELQQPLLRSDRRAVHILKVLKRCVGDTFDAGVVNGARGKATVRAVTADALELAFAATVAAPAASNVTLIVGMPRPQTARDVLRDATTLGVAAIHFVPTEKAERSYAQSSLWTTGDWRRHVIAGAEQAFDTRIPEVTWDKSFADALNFAARGPRYERMPTVPPDTTTPPDNGRPAASAEREPVAMVLIALDNYEAAEALANVRLSPATNVVIAVGAERGWSAAERTQLRAAGFVLAHLGSRVLRTETAVVAALAVLEVLRRT